MTPVTAEREGRLTPRGTCTVCGRPASARRMYQRGDGALVCRDCIAGYVMCEHGYAQRGVCYRCREGKAHG